MLLVTTLVTPLACATRVAPEGWTEGQCAIAWSPAETIRTERGTRVYVEHPDVVPHPRGTLLFGHLSVESTDRGIVVLVSEAGAFKHAGVLLRRDGRAEFIPLPPSPMLGWPRAAALGGGRVAVVWGVSESDTTTEQALWSAELEDGAWIEPVRVMEQAMLRWTSSSQSALISVGDELRMTVARFDPEGALLVRRVGDEWSSIELEVTWAFYTALAPLPGDTLVVVYVGGALDLGNALFAQRFDLGGAAVSPRVRLNTANGVQGYDPRVVLAPDSTLLATWTETDLSGDSRHIGVARSTDLGRTWVVHERLTVPDGPLGIFGAAVDSSGVLHVTALATVDDRTQPLHLYWDGQWSGATPPTVPRSIAISRPTVIFGSGDSIRLVWGALDARNTRRIPPMLLSSAGRMTCRSPDTLRHDLR
ncbi:MAG TPA: hypothetical protein VMM18_05660 [Gemmatimonadaceae bacterium]|nr:hypothetical protein [Gemmatimonadaceae bacterium]